MQVVIDVTCMHTNIGGRGLSAFGDIALSKTAKFPFLTMDYSPWSSENLIDRNRLKNSCKEGLMSSSCIGGGRCFLVWGHIGTMYSSFM